MRKVNLLLCLGLFSLALIWGCAKKEGKVVTKVGDRKITVEDLENEYQRQSRLIIKGRSELDRRRDALDKLIRDQVVILGAYKEGLDKEVENDTAVQKQKEEVLLRAMYEKEILNKSKVSESELKRHYEKLKEEIHAWHILVETKAQADSIYQQLKEGADFGELAKERSIDPSAPNNAGDLGFFGWGRMVPEFQEVAFKLKEGEISRPVETTQFGWHIIKLVERREVEQPPFEQAKDMIRSKLERDKTQRRVREYFDELKKKVNFKLNEEALDLLMSKKTEVLPENLGLRRMGDKLEIEKFTDEEKNMTLFTHKGGQITVGDFVDQFNNTPPQYRPKLNEREKILQMAFQNIVKDILLEVAQDQKLENTEDFKENWQRSIEQEMAKRMRSEVLEGVGITDEEIQSYYDRHPDRYEEPAEVHIKEILVKTEDEASDILKQLKKGANFEKLAEEKTIRTHVKNKGGDLESFRRSRYPELFDSAFPMKKGELKGPIKITDRQFGESYAVIKLIEKKEARKTPLDEIKDQVTLQARREKDNKIFNQWVDKQKARLTIEINEKVLKSTVKEKIEEEEKTEEKG